MSTKLVLMNISANLASFGISNYLEKKGIKKDKIDKATFDELFLYMEMLTSTWAHAAIADAEFQDEEEDVIYHFFKYLFVEKDPRNPGSEPILPTKALEKAGIDVIEMLSKLRTRFNEPYTLNEIVDYAKAHLMQQIFYVQALCIVIADKIITIEEREFIDEFAEMLKLKKDEQKQMEKQYFMILKKNSSK